VPEIGITTTIPVEVVLSAGFTPRDLNNVFIGDPNPEQLVYQAEKEGFPQNCCAWIKGIYGACRKYSIKDVICVTTGDCSNTIMLMEILKRRGHRVIPFAYPETPQAPNLQPALERLAQCLGTSLAAAEKMRTRLGAARRAAGELDRLTWQTRQASGWENHLWMVSASDFNQDHDRYRSALDALIEDCRQRTAYPADWPAIGYTGVPPVYARDLYACLEHNRAAVVFNEVQRQFAMPFRAGDIAAQYSRYTYPYSIYDRIRDIRREIKRRRIDGIIHYVQSFCHRGIGDIIFREMLDRPVLTLEGNDEFILSPRARTQIEAFLDMLRRHHPGASSDSAVA
jgi:benzoyl-CoA reductase/2-hydroxyglutaryl-CoA dehydratase subunit BcrC/BadD/HgdB